MNAQTCTNKGYNIVMVQIFHHAPSKQLQGALNRRHRQGPIVDVKSLDCTTTGHEEERINKGVVWLKDL